MQQCVVFKVLNLFIPYSGDSWIMYSFSAKHITFQSNSGYEFANIKLSIANLYESSPKPDIEPLHLGAISELWRNSSRAKMLEICTSTTGVEMAAIVSLRATEVCV